MILQWVSWYWEKHNDIQLNTVTFFKTNILK